MKKSLFIVSLIIPVLTLFAAIFIFSTQPPNTENHNIGKFIKAEIVSEKVTVVRMDYDAVTAIATQNGIVVIDAGISHSLTAEYRKVIEQVFGRNDFAYLINTHSHPDHIGGNQVFVDAVIVGHENCLNEIPDYWKDIEKIKTGLLKIVNDYENQLKTFDPEWQDSLEIYLQKVRYQHTYKDLIKDRNVTVPTKTFKDTMNVSMGDITLNLIYFGKAHSKSDIIIHIPEEKILMVGDLFSQGGRPSIGDANKEDFERWIIVKHWIDDRMDKIDKIIGGHGQIMDSNDLESFLEYIEDKSVELK